MQTALVDSNGMVTNIIHLIDPANYPPLPSLPTAPSDPATPLTDDARRSFQAAAVQHLADVSAYVNSFQQALQVRYAPPAGFSVQQVNDWVGIGQPVDMAAPVAGA